MTPWFTASARTPEELTRFMRGTQLRTVFNQARGDENYYVAEVR